MSNCENKPLGVFSWNELMTNDVEGAKKFYGELLGWAMEKYEGCTETDYTMAKANDQDVAGIMAIPPQEAMPPCWGAYVTVSDVDDKTEQAKALGGKIIMGPQDIPNVGRFVVIQDPQGAILSLIAYNQG